MMTEKITSNQENRIIDLFRDGLRTLDFTKEEAQEIIKAGGQMQEHIKPILQKLAAVDQCFGPALKDFEFVVSSDFNHDTQIDTFVKKTKNLKTTYFLNKALTSKNFAKATRKLEQGKTYRVRIFPLLKGVTSEDCIMFLKKQRAILVGGQGITLLQESKPEKFPVGKWTVSFDEKEALWQDAIDSHKVPIVGRHSDSDWRFPLGSFENDWDSGNCLLCVCEK